MAFLQLWCPCLPTLLDCVSCVHNLCCVRPPSPPPPQYWKPFHVFSAFALAMQAHLEKCTTLTPLIDDPADTPQPADEVSPDVPLTTEKCKYRENVVVAYDLAFLAKEVQPLSDPSNVQRIGRAYFEAWTNSVSSEV